MIADVDKVEYENMLDYWSICTNSGWASGSDSKREKLVTLLHSRKKKEMERSPIYFFWSWFFRLTFEKEWLSGVAQKEQKVSEEEDGRKRLCQNSW